MCLPPRTEQECKRSLTRAWNELARVSDRGLSPGHRRSQRRPFRCAAASVGRAAYNPGNRVRFHTISADDVAVEAARTEPLEVERHEAEPEGPDLGNQTLPDLGREQPRQLGQRHLDPGDVPVMTKP